MTVGPDDARRDDPRPAAEAAGGEDDVEAPPDPAPPPRPSWQQAPFGSAAPARPDPAPPERPQPAAQPAAPAPAQSEPRREDAAATTALTRPTGSGTGPAGAAMAAPMGGGPGGPAGPSPYRASPPPAVQRPTGYGADTPRATSTPAARPTQARPGRSRPAPRRARLTVKRIDPWSVLKFSFVYSLAGVIVLLVAAAALYSIVDAMGVIDSLRTFLNDVEGGSAGLSKWLGFGRMMTIAIVIGAVNVVLFTAFATLTAFVYNVCTEIVGGVEVTLADAPGTTAPEVASSGGRGL